VNIVLASGYLFPQKIGPINYFRDVTAHLEAAGHVVLPPDVPPLASCNDRAKKLGAAIEGKFGKSPVHIIAHSMGGLDSRMAIGMNYGGLGEPGRVISLTTLSTPHLGSPVADLLVGNGSDTGNFRGGVLNVIQNLGIDTGALRDLTSKGVKAIPNIVETKKGIKYFSYAARGHDNPPPTIHQAHAERRQRWRRDGRLGQVWLLPGHLAV
jgi:triacylglycerol lipase